MREIVDRFVPRRRRSCRWSTSVAVLGISYLPMDNPPPVAELAAKLAHIVATSLRPRDCRCRRSMVERAARSPAPGTVTLYEVGTIKDVTLDAGATAAVRQCRRRHERQHPHVAVPGEYDARLVSRDSDGAPSWPVSWDKHCESGDIVIRDAWIPTIWSGRFARRRGHGRILLFDVQPYNLLTRPGGGSAGRRLTPNLA